MTREEAVEVLRQSLNETGAANTCLTNIAGAATEMAIEALTELSEVDRHLDEFGSQHQRDGKTFTVAERVEEAMLALRVRIAALEAENSRLSKTPVLRLKAEGDTELRAVAALALNGLMAGTPDYCIGHTRDPKDERDIPNVKHIEVLADAAKVAAQELLRRLDEPKTDLGQRLEEVAEALAHQAALATTSVDQDKWETRREAVLEARDALEKAAEEARGVAHPPCQQWVKVAVARSGEAPPARTCPAVHASAHGLLVCTREHGHAPPCSWKRKRPEEKCPVCTGACEWDKETTG